MPLRVPELTPEQRHIFSGLTGILSGEREPIGEENDVLLWRTGTPASRFILCKIVKFDEVWYDIDDADAYALIRPYVNVAIENPAGSGQFARFRRNWQTAIDPEYRDSLDLFNRIFFLQQNFGEDCLDIDTADSISEREYDEPVILLTGSAALTLLERLSLDMDATGFTGDDVQHVKLE